MISHSIEISPDKLCGTEGDQINPLFCTKAWRKSSPSERRNNSMILYKNSLDPSPAMAQRVFQENRRKITRRIRRLVDPSIGDAHGTKRRIESGAKVTTKRGRRDDWRTQTDSNAVASRFSRGAATLDVPTPLVEGAHARSVRLPLVSSRFLSLLFLLSSPLLLFRFFSSPRVSFPIFSSPRRPLDISFVAF